MTNRFTRLLSLSALLVICGLASGRVWTDATGRYTIDADLIGFNDDTVVLQRSDGELGALPIEKLSQADRDYLHSKVAEETAQKVTGQLQTWTLRDGMKVVGRVVGYARKDVTPGRNSAQATANALAQHPGYVAGPVRRVSRF